MTLRLEALSPEEGIAIVRAGRAFRLVRPPYRSENGPTLGESAVRDAILRCGFSASNAEFANWSDLVAYLNETVRSSRAELGQEIVDESPRAIVELAPIEVLEAFLKRVEMELIPNRHYRLADAFLLEFIDGNRWVERPQLLRRAVRALTQSLKARRTRDLEIQDLEPRSARFTNLGDASAIEASERLSKAVRERRCLFA